MRIPRTAAIAGMAAAGSALAAAGATWAWSGAEAGSAREKLAGAGYAPATIGAVAAIGAGLLAALPAARGASGRVAAVAGAAAIGGAIGTAATRLGGVEPPVTRHDAGDLPAPDMERVAREVREVVDAVDPDAEAVVIWAPGTMRHSIPREFRDSVERQLPDAALVKLPTRSDYRIREGVADTVEVIEGVVRELDARGHGTILLSAESQGAWATSVALERPQVRDLVDRSVLWANPGLSPTQWEDGHDSEVIELSDDYDVIARTTRGDADLVVDALEDVFGGRLDQAWRLPAVAFNNPFEGWLLLKSGIRVMLPGGYERDPHNYREHMPVAARLLADAAEREQVGVLRDHLLEGIATQALEPFTHGAPAED